MSVFSNNRFLKRVNPEIVRAKDDSGSSLNHPEIQKLMRQMVDLGIADNLKLWVHNGLVKTRTSGSDLYVPKAYDISGEENDAVQATEAKQPKLVSDGMEFDGLNDRLTISDDASLQITGAMTIMAWVYYIGGTTTSSQAIIGKYGTGGYRGYLLFVNPDDGSKDARFIIASNSSTVRAVVSDENSLPFNQWFLLTGVYVPSTSLTVYINTTAYENTTSIPSSQYSNNGLPLDLSWFDSTGRYVKQNLNDIRIFNSALTSTQISAIFNATKGFYGIT